MKPLLWALLAVLALPAVAAQDGCDESAPCVWAVQIDADGLSAPGGELEGTVGDWFVFDFDNVDPDDDHTVTWSADGSSWTVEYLSSHRTDAFLLSDEGTFELEDDPSGDTLAVAVTLDDVVDDGDDDPGTGAPGPGVVLLVAVLGAVLWIRRR